MSRLYRVSFNYVDSSGSQLNQSLFGSKELALSFCLQINNAKNVQDVSCDLVTVEKLSNIFLCDELHGINGKYVLDKE